MNDKEFLDKIYNAAKDIDTPEALNPDKISDRLSKVRRKSVAPVLIPTLAALVIIASAVLGVLVSNDKLSWTLENENFVGVSNSTGKELASVVSPKSYDDVYDTLAKINLKNRLKMQVNTNDMLESDSGMTMNSSDYSDLSTDFSATNTQVKDVDEADSVKTDGKYIYSFDNKNIYISKVANGKIEKISSTAVDFDENSMEFEMYLNEKFLVIVCVSNNYSYGCIDGVGIDSDKTTLLFYDITDKKEPVLSHTLSQDGHQISTRVTDGILYLVTSYSSDITDEITNEDITEYVPALNCDGDVNVVDINDICIVKNSDDTTFVTLSSVDLANPETFMNTKSLVGGGSDIYCSSNYLYIYKDNYQDEETTFLKYQLNRGDIELVAEKTLKGSVLNQFAMDESNGYFRVVTCTNSAGWFVNTEDENEQNKQLVYVMDENLNVVGLVVNESGNEQLKSVRFLDDYVYFVTFMQTDPLYAVDLTDPQKPKIVSELKIPGFSTYMHPFTENRLLGLGYDANEDTGMTTGLKLSMFNTENKEDIFEICSTKFSDDYSYAPALYNHKALLIDGEKNIIGLAVESEREINENYEYTYDSYYYVFSYNEDNEIKQEAKILITNEYEDLELNNGETYIGYSEENMRGIYIGDYLYVVSEYQISSYSLNDYQLVQKEVF